MPSSSIFSALTPKAMFSLCVDSKSIREAITDCLPDSNLAVLVPVLERFVVTASFPRF